VMIEEDGESTTNLDLMRLASEPMSSANWQGANRDPLGIENSQIIKIMEGKDMDRSDVLSRFDRVEREPDSNHLIEGTIKLAANVTELVETQH